jgi:hypothetical protein
MNSENRQHNAYSVSDAAIEEANRHPYRTALILVLFGTPLLSVLLLSASWVSEALTPWMRVALALLGVAVGAGLLVLRDPISVAKPIGLVVAIVTLNVFGMVVVGGSDFTFNGRSGEPVSIDIAGQLQDISGYMFVAAMVLFAAFVWGKVWAERRRN